VAETQEERRPGKHIMKVKCFDMKMKTKIKRFKLMVFIFLNKNIFLLFDGINGRM
jgi:hypothetical protein